VSKCSRPRTQALSLNEFVGAGYKAKLMAHFLDDLRKAGLPEE